MKTDDAYSLLPHDLEKLRTKFYHAVGVRDPADVFLRLRIVDAVSYVAAYWVAILLIGESSFWNSVLIVVVGMPIILRFLPPECPIGLVSLTGRRWKREEESAVLPQPFSPLNPAVYKPIVERRFDRIVPIREIAVQIVTLKNRVAQIRAGWDTWLADICDRDYVLTDPQRFRLHEMFVDLDSLHLEIACFTDDWKRQLRRFETLCHGFPEQEDLKWLADFEKSDKKLVGLENEVLKVVSEYDSRRIRSAEQLVELRRQIEKDNRAVL